MLHVVINAVDIALKNWLVYNGKVVLNAALLKIVPYYRKHFRVIFEISKRYYEIHLTYSNMDTSMCSLCSSSDFKYMYNLKYKKKVSLGLAIDLYMNIWDLQFMVFFIFGYKFNSYPTYTFIWIKYIKVWHV